VILGNGGGYANSKIIAIFVAFYVIKKQRIDENLFLFSIITILPFFLVVTRYWA